MFIIVLVGFVLCGVVIKIYRVGFKNSQLENGCDILREDFVIYPSFSSTFVLYERILEGPVVFFRDLVSKITFRVFLG